MTKTGLLALCSLALVTGACVTPTANAHDATAPQRTITVSGEGEATATPDLIIISIGVRSEAKTAAEALRANSRDVSAAIATLKENSVASKDIQTSGLSINPQYNYNRNSSAPRQITGYVAANTLTVRLRDLESAGAIIDATVQSGANNLGGVSFTFAEPKPLYDKARQNAVKDAIARAKLLTNAAGVKLGPIVTINDGYIQAPSRNQVNLVSARAESDVAVPLEAGESSVRANINIIFEIE